MTQQIQYMYNIDPIFYTAFITKEHFQIFGEMVEKILKMRKYHLFFVKYVCILMDC